MIEEARVGRGIAAGRATDGALVHLDHLVDVLQAFDALVGERLCVAAVEGLAEDGIQRVADERALAAAADPRYADEGAQREVHIHVLQVVAAGAFQHQAMAAALATFCRCRDALFAAEELRRERIAPHELGRRALRHDVPAVHTSTGTDVDDVVGAHHHLAVVLHHQHAVAAIAQLAQAADQALVIAHVQSDARLVEDVQHAGELAADLRGQADALGLATTERTRTAVKREVFQANVEQEATACRDLLHHVARDHGLLLIELSLQRGHVLVQRGDAHLRKLRDVLVRDPEPARELLQP